MGKLRTKVTSPIAKSTGHGVSDTTFFARWQWHLAASTGGGRGEWCIIPCTCHGCCLTGARLPEAPSICSRATKILNKKPHGCLNDSYGNSLYAHFPLTNDRIPCSFCNLKWNIKCVFIDLRQKFPLIKVSKQALFWKSETQTTGVSRLVNQVSSICLLIFLIKFYWTMGS